MIKRRRTLDQTQKIRKNKLVETLGILDLCLQIPADDRLLIRNKIKNGDEDLSARVYQCKRDKNYHELQVFLRKYLQHIKTSNRYCYSSYKNRQSSHRKIEKTPSTTQLKNNHTETSNRNSVQGSYHSSPQQRNVDSSLKMSDWEHIQKKINFQINASAEKQTRRDNGRECLQKTSQRTVKKEKIQQSYRQIRQTNRNRYTQAIENSKPYFDNPFSQLETNQPFGHNNIAMNIKSVLREKLMTQQPTDNPYKQKQNRLVINTDNCHRSSRILTQQNTNKYGEFYKRIKMTIEDDL